MSVQLGAHIMGFIGMLMVTFAYLALMLHKLTARDIAYSLWNLIGAILLLLSLLVNFNLGSFIIEIFWIGISICGVYQWATAKAKN